MDINVCIESKMTLELLNSNFCFAVISIFMNWITQTAFHPTV